MEENPQWGAAGAVQVIAKGVAATVRQSRRIQVLEPELLEAANLGRVVVLQSYTTEADPEFHELIKHTA
ncbi:unnamed protein product [Allacma fusca]|uniref:Uncharacterized protein n=1 Tax=Allacma fusca TaxID=39272 RepID=A0A8J2JDC1_9HEXA|nr:unnamed protein product [Allacma fusca]